MSATLPSRAKIPSRRATCESSIKVFTNSPLPPSSSARIKSLKRTGAFETCSIGKPIKIHDTVPPMMIRKAAGLFNALSGAPFRIMPTKTEIMPITSPITVDFSKAGNLLCCRIKKIIADNILQTPRKKSKKNFRAEIK